MLSKLPKWSAMATVLTGPLKILFYLVKLDKENAVQTNGTQKGLF